MTSLLQIAGVCERDLDLLLVEELIASSAFRSLIAEAAGLPAIAPHAAPHVSRSVTHSSGESDVEFFVELSDGRPAAVLIENKVDAAFQPKQQERYQARGASYITSGRCQVCRTLVVAPRRYFGTDASPKGFDASLTYEDIDQWFANQPDLGPRADYKRSLIAAAIEKAALGYQPVADRVMSSFWLRYREWVELHAPHLNMPDQNRGRPSGSTSVFFKPDRLPKGILLVHKFTHGHLDLEFSGQGEQLGRLREELRLILPEGSSLVRAGKSVALRVVVPPLDATSPEDQEQLAAVGIQAAVDLLAWYWKHESALTSCLSSTA